MIELIGAQIGRANLNEQSPLVYTSWVKLELLQNELEVLLRIMEVLQAKDLVSKSFQVCLAKLACVATLT